MSHHVTERYKMNDSPTNERLAQAAQAAQVKRVFDMIDCLDSELFDIEDLEYELTDLLRSLGVEVVR